MRIEPFVMERWQSTFEHQVAYNLSESGVHPLTLKELVEMPGGDDPLAYDEMGEILLGYTQGNGLEALRDLVALLYHAVVTRSIRGPVNGTAPYPVPNGTFTSTLGRVLGRRYRP